MAGRNRLSAESSPYLRQHRDNPVDWFPWGDEAFEEARRRDVPILLSVGYSACHWCHVMAHESFEDDATAAVMNERFVNVKVDREERPDVDAVYMEAVQSLTGHGGWPMTVFLDHDGRPFYGGTYFPPEPRHGMPSFTQVLDGVATAWVEQREELSEQAERLTEAIRRSTELEPAADGMPSPQVLGEAAARIRSQHDPRHGGFGRAPKFPQTMAIELLLRVHARTGDRSMLEVAVHSLDHMAAGGIYDHLGGGFARYSTDERWLVPHFEKMLYDQALLARAYLHAWQVTGEERHLQVLSETVEYVLRDLRAPAGGGLCSAEDADSEGVEGKFYVWSLDEVEEVTGDDFDAARTWWEVSGAGSWEGTNILHRPVVGDLLRPPEVERARQALFERRLTRVRPGLDDKVLTEWNALFLSTLAEAAFLHDEWREAAEEIGGFLLANLRRADGRWLRSWQAETGGRHLAYAADHAALVDSFTRLYEATGRRRWLDEAGAVADAMLELFWDDENGGLFTTGNDADPLVARQKDLIDGATPSASSTAATALARLAALTGEAAYRDRSEAIVRLLGPLATSHPMAFANLLAALDILVGTTEIVVTGDRPDLVAEVQRRYLPTSVLAWGERFDSPLWEGRADGLAYVCEGFTCKQPVDTVEGLSAFWVHPAV